MASTITHIVQGKKIFNRLPKKLHWEEFLIGATFPDIRYTAKIDRNITHIKNTSEDKVPLNNAFEAGRYVHCFIDERRVKILMDLGITKFIDYNPVNETALKLVEDVVLFKYIDDLEELNKVFSKTVPEESLYVNSLDAIKGWHEGIKYYLSAGPNEKSWRRMFSEINLPNEKAEEIIKKTDDYLKNKKIIKILETLNEKI